MKKILGALGSILKKVFLIIEYIACLALGCIVTIFVEDLLYTYGYYYSDPSLTGLMIISIMLGNIFFTLIKCNIKKFF